MYFKTQTKIKIKVTLILVGITALIASCTLRQTPPGSQPLNVNEASLSCIDNMSGTIDSYLNGTASDADVTHFGIALRKRWILLLSG